MLLPEQVQRLVELALAEFTPEWQVTGLCSELSLHNPDHWVSGLGTFGLILRNRQNRSAKVLGWRSGDFRSATYHRGISYRVLEAYADRITDPIRRYFEEIGLMMPGRVSPRGAQTATGRSRARSGRRSPARAFESPPRRKTSSARNSRAAETARAAAGASRPGSA